MAIPVRTDFDMGGQAKVINMANGTAPTDAVTVQQLNAAIEGLAFKDDVRVASSANINIASPGASIDGVALSVNDRVLLRGQTTNTENGIYIWNGAAVAMTRAADMSLSAEFNSAIVPVLQGTDAGTQWRQTAVNPILGTTPILFVSNGVSAPAASETTSGILEIATQPETDTGTDDQRAVTPLKLATTTLVPKGYKQTFGDGASTSYTITHNLNSQDVMVQVIYATGNRETVLIEERRPTVNTVQLLFAAAPALNSMRVLILRV